MSNKPRSAGRAAEAKATVIPRKAGFPDIANLSCGMLRWRAEGDAVEGGTAIEHIAEYSI